MFAADTLNAESEVFYRDINIDTLRGIVVQAGLDSGADVDLVFSYLQSTHQHILNIGGCYGRVESLTEDW